MSPTKIELYRLHLGALPVEQWEAYLLAESGLPGPRGNLELAQAYADVASRGQSLALLTWDAERAPTNDPHEFLAFCGTVGLGALLALGEHDVLPLLGRAAADVRWRLREATAMALQRWGLADLPALLDEMERWVAGSHYEQRAVMAALCEPALLKDVSAARRTLVLLDGITTNLLAAPDRRDEGWKVLRQGLAYGWSVAAAALPAEGLPMMARWVGCQDRDARWIMAQNLDKKRLARLDAAWVATQKARLAG
jgi:hypothetical protein